MATEWIGVAEVAAEMGLSDRAAWELIKRVGVPMTEGERARMKTARFRRVDFEEARDRSMAPAPARAPYTRAAGEGAAATPASTPAAPRPAAGRTSATVAASKRARLRAL